MYVSSTLNTQSPVLATLLSLSRDNAQSAVPLLSEDGSYAVLSVMQAIYCISIFTMVLVTSISCCLSAILHCAGTIVTRGPPPPEGYIMLTIVYTIILYSIIMMWQEECSCNNRLLSKIVYVKCTASCIECLS